MDIYMTIFLSVVVGLPLYYIASIIVCTIFTTIFDGYPITILEYILFPLLLVPLLALAINTVIRYIVYIFEYSFNVLLFGRNYESSKKEDK